MVGACNWIGAGGPASRSLSALPCLTPACPQPARITARFVEVRGAQLRPIELPSVRLSTALPAVLLQVFDDRGKQVRCLRVWRDDPACSSVCKPTPVAKAPSASLTCYQCW